jgi:hypothetical protein
MHVVVKQANLWDLLTISNTNEWKTYIAKPLGCGGPFTNLVWLHTKAQSAPVITKKKE